MPKFYNPISPSKVYNPYQDFRLSRSKIENYIRCQKCFFLENKIGLKQIPMIPFNLNIAVDELLKKEFDWHRKNQELHPLIDQYGLNFVPFDHPQIDVWRNSLSAGISYKDPKTNFIVFGGVDDVWQDPESSKIVIVDYKATSKAGRIEKLSSEWHAGYKRQLEIYAWLFDKNGFDIYPDGYFVYCNANKDKEAFDGVLEFDLTLIPHKLDFSWVDGKVQDIYDLLNSSEIPNSNSECEYCAYFDARHDHALIGPGYNIYRNWAHDKIPSDIIHDLSVDGFEVINEHKPSGENQKFNYTYSSRYVLVKGEMTAKIDNDKFILRSGDRLDLNADTAVEFWVGDSGCDLYLTKPLA